MRLIICPGFHDPDFTRSFLEGLPGQLLGNLSQYNLSVFPAGHNQAYSAFHILHFLGYNVDTIAGRREQVVFVAFSAGVVGAIGAAWAIQFLGGNVKAFFALDGWGVPLYGNFPIHRLSHDFFTHWSSAILGCGDDRFYADPPVPHLELWRSPQTARGFWVRSRLGEPVSVTPTTASEFLTHFLLYYCGDI